MDLLDLGETSFKQFMGHSSVYHSLDMLSESKLPWGASLEPNVGLLLLVLATFSSLSRSSLPILAMGIMLGLPDLLPNLANMRWSAVAGLDLLVIGAASKSWASVSCSASISLPILAMGIIGATSISLPMRAIGIMLGLSLPILAIGIMGVSLPILAMGIMGIRSPLDLLT